MKTESEVIYLTTADLAERTGLSSSGVLVDVRKGRLTPAARTARGVRLFDRDDVDRWLADRAARRRPVAA